MIGRKNRRVSFERPYETPDAVGDVDKAWLPVATVWASVEPLRGEERYQAQQIQATADHRIRVRWSTTLATLTPKHRAKLGTRIFEIVSVADLTTDHRELELLATERLS